VPFGPLLLGSVLVVQDKLPDDGYATLDVGGTRTCLDLTDPRFVYVVHELLLGSHTALLARYLGPGDTFIDVGANQGAYAVVASTLVGEHGRVVAFEPQPRLATALCASLRHTPASFDVHDVALGARNAVVNFIVPRSYSGMAGLHPDFSGTTAHETYTVPLRRFDDLVEPKACPGAVFVKLDIEGNEWAFFQGATAFLKARKPRILMEVNPTSLRAADVRPEALKQMLVDLGYASYQDIEEPAVRHDLATLSLTERRRDVVLFAA
jgi:FkbM family methyltransferase